MRVSTTQVQQQAISSILDQQSKMARTQLQLSSGRRILTPSDDPAAAKSILSLDQAIEVTEQYQRNADAAESRLGTEEAVLAGVIDTFQRARELAVRGTNDSLDAEDRAAIGAEVRELLDGLLSLANTKDSNGEYLFAGFQSDTQPFSGDGAGNFTYSGDQGQRHLKIGPSRQIAVTDSGYGIFMDLSNTSQDAFSTLYDLATDMENNTPNASRLDEIDAAMESVAGVRAQIGSRLNAIDSQREANEGQILQYQGAKGSLENLDYAEAISELKLQMTSLEAAQQSFVKVQDLSLFNYLR